MGFGISCPVDASTLSPLVSFLHAAGFSQALLLALYFWKGRQKPGNVYESLLLFTIAIVIAFGYLYSSHAILSYPHLARFGFSFMALLGPLLYLSVRARDSASNRMYRSDLLFWLVPVGITLYLSPFHFSPAEIKLQYLREDLQEIHFDCVVILYCGLANNIIAMTLSIGRMHRVAARIFQQARAGSRLTADEPEASFKIDPAYRDNAGNFWFHAAPLGTILCTGIVSALDPNILNSGLFSGVASIIIVIRSYLLLFRSADDTADTIYPPAARYQKALLSEDFVLTRGTKINAYLDEEQPHLEPDFQLSDIAGHLGLSTVQTSQIINRHFGKSFLQLARTVRVDVARELLRTRPASSTVLDIALESGFNSKSAFNSAFKKITGQTPSDWRGENTPPAA